MGTNFIKVISMVSVYRKCLFIPKSRDKLYLNIVRLTEVFRQLASSMKIMLRAKLMRSAQLLKNLAHKLKTFDTIQL